MSPTTIYNQRLQPCWIFATTGSPLPWQPTQVSCTSTATPAGNILDLKYNFNLGADNGNVLGITNNRDTTRSQNFAYDQVNRLVTAATTSTSGANCWGQSYTYDQWANLTDMTVTQCSAPMLSPTVNANNQITSGGMTYDLSGNVKYDGTYSYDWYADGRLDSISDKVTYIYDVFGNRTEKGGTGVTTKWYWYGLGSQALDESDGSGNVTDEYIYFGGKRVAHLTVSSGLTDFYVADHLGTSRALLQSGQTSLCYDADFLPFGTERAVTTTCTQNYKFTGKERDSESGLDNFGARYNSSNMGRFMSPDPMGGTLLDPQTLNKYAYVRDNPLTLIDPTGLYTVLCEGGDKACTNAANSAEKQRLNDLRSKHAKAQEQSFFGRIFGKIGGWVNAAAVPFMRWGRLGGPAHRAEIARQQRALEEQGYKVDREAYIKTPNGAKSGRFADIRGVKGGETVYVQVGKTNQDGTPVAREVQAMDDIEGATGIRPNFAPYDIPPPTPVAPVDGPFDVPVDVPVGPEIPVDPIP